MSAAELQGMSVLSADQLGRWATASRRAFADHAEERTGSDRDPTVLMVELLCSASNRLAQLCREEASRARRFSRGTDTYDGEPASGEGGWNDE
jgi:hypothetical protein